MFEAIRELIGTSYAPHGYCLLWQPWLIWTTALADALIALAYFSIPLALVVFVRKRRDIAFGGVFWLFALFITACGTTHVLGIWNLWHGDYGVEAAVKVVTAIASVFTAILLWPLIPKALALPSPALLREANAALRAEIVERENAEAALLQSRKMEAVGQLTGGIAHDFNNLLQVIGGSLEMIESRVASDEKLKRLSDGALGAVERARRLTAQLLSFSRVQRLSLEMISITDLLPDLQEMLHRTIGPLIELEIHSAAAPYRVIADKTQIELAILNLALNARDAMPDGGKLAISLDNTNVVGKADIDDGDYLAISVTDEGVGMSPEILQRVFEPFFTTKPVGQGSGLGLSMVFAMTRQSGGSVAIESERGKGTTVTLYLRRAADGAGILRESDAIPDHIARLSGAHILVVDDEAQVREIVVEMLADFGCSVIEAENGQQALQKLEIELPSAILLDFAMPGMNGADVALAARAKWPDARIVFATGFAQSDAIDAVMGGNAILLRKPFTAAGLADALARALAEPA